MDISFFYFQQVKCNRNRLEVKMKNLPLNSRYIWSVFCMDINIRVSDTRDLIHLSYLGLPLLQFNHMKSQTVFKDSAYSDRAKSINTISTQYGQTLSTRHLHRETLSKLGHKYYFLFCRLFYISTFSATNISLQQTLFIRYFKINGMYA